MTWTGWDGTVWTLTDEAGGVYLPNAGVRGLNAPKSEIYTSESPARDGARYQGARRLPREVFWPIEVFTDGGSEAWLNLDAAFWRTLDEDRPGTLRVTRPNLNWRELELRYVDDGDHSFVPDPSVVGWEVYEVTLMAYQPYWRGKTIVAGPWSAAGDQPPLYPEGGGHVSVADGSTLGEAVVMNPGDVDVWPLHRVSDTENPVTITLNGQDVSVPFAVDGELVIDTDNQVALLNGEDVTGDIGDIDFEPLQPRVPTTIAVEIVGAGQVSTEFVPLYRRAW
jgi:hypothetical protein